MHDFLNDLKHFTGGVLISLGGFLVFGSFYVAGWMAIQLGLTMETCQYFYHDNYDLKLPDRIRDFSGYVIGYVVIAIIWSFFRVSLFLL